MWLENVESPSVWPWHSKAVRPLYWVMVVLNWSHPSQFPIPEGWPLCSRGKSIQFLCIKIKVWGEKHTEIQVIQRTTKEVTFLTCSSFLAYKVTLTLTPVWKFLSKSISNTTRKILVESKWENLVQNSLNNKGWENYWTSLTVIDSDVNL